MPKRKREKRPPEWNKVVVVTEISVFIFSDYLL